MRALREALPAADAARLADQATAHVLALPELAAPQRVALYAAMTHAREIDTAVLHQALRARGHTLAYPRVRGRGEVLDLHLVDDLATLILSKLGIPQPAPDAPAAPLGSIDLFLVPGLAFGEQGERLGWGAGHYDRTLSAAPRALRVGLAFDFQIIAGIPQLAGDERMDVVVTDAGVRARPRRNP